MLGLLFGFCLHQALPPPDRTWESVGEFQEWYRDLSLPALPPGNDCDDYAERLQRVALQQGYPVSIALVRDGTYYGVEVRDSSRQHAGCLVLIDGTFYYVGAQYLRMVELCRKD